LRDHHRNLYSAGVCVMMAYVIQPKSPPKWLTLKTREKLATSLVGVKLSIVEFFPGLYLSIHTLAKHDENLPTNSSDVDIAILVLDVFRRDKYQLAKFFYRNFAAREARTVLTE